MTRSLRERQRQILGNLTGMGIECKSCFPLRALLLCSMGDPPSGILTFLWLSLFRLHIYMRDYLVKRNFTKAAQVLASEASIRDDETPPLNHPQGLLFECVLQVTEIRDTTPLISILPPLALVELFLGFPRGQSHYLSVQLYCLLVDGGLCSGTSSWRKPARAMAAHKMRTCICRRISNNP